MDINWLEVLVGGAIFLVIGAVFTIFVQPRIERRLAARRDRRSAKREAEDAAFAADVARMVASPDYYTARYREGVLRVLGLVVSGALLVSAAFIFDMAVGFVGGGWMILAVAALLMFVPAASVSSKLLTLASAVRSQLEEPSTPRAGNESPTTTI